MAKQRKTPKAVKLRAGLLTKLLIVILLAALVCEVYALRADIEEGCTPEKMQEIARRELGWVLPGEYVFEVGS